MEQHLLTPGGSEGRVDPEQERDRSQTWLLLPPEVVPSDWQRRARTVVLVPLLPEESDQLLVGRPVPPAIDERDEELIVLLARGASVARAAQMLSVTERTVTRRLAALRERFGVATTSQLIAFLARRGL